MRAASNVIELRPTRTSRDDPRPVEDFAALGALKAVSDAIASLERDGYRVAAFAADCFRAPVVWLWPHAHLRHMADTGSADYAEQGTDEDGDYRVGGFERLGCAVRWFERGRC